MANDSPEGAGAPGKKSDNTLIIVVVVAACLFGFCIFAGIIAAIAIPNLIEARKGSNEAASIGALRTITTAQALFREGDKENDKALDYGTLDELQRAMLVDGVLGSGTKQGYIFTVEPDAREPMFRFTARARPAKPGQSGDRYFFVDETGIIRFSTQRDATAQDRAIGG